MRFDFKKPNIRDGVSGMGRGRKSCLRGRVMGSVRRKYSVEVEVNEKWMGSDIRKALEGSGWRFHRNSEWKREEKTKDTTRERVGEVGGGDW